MKKNILLSFCLFCVCGISACRSHSENMVPIISDEEPQPAAIDATVKPYDKCGVDGISCNDTALINYTKTEADYRAYGERTEQDHLYTQASAGNNLVATVPPAFEEDIVTDNTISGNYDMSNMGYDMPNTGYDMPNTGYDMPNTGYDMSNMGYAMPPAGYEMVCVDNCDEFSDNSDLQLPEFTEESFDIADYVKSNDDNIEFTEIGEAKQAVDEVVEEEIADDTILTWEAKEGDNLRELLTAWSAKSGWKLLWNTNRNYTLTAGVMFKGKFTDVSSALIRAFARARPAPIATYYKGNRVIVVETMENENAY